MEVWKEVMEKEVKPGQKYVEIVAFCDNGEEDDDMMMDNDVDLPSIFVEVWSVWNKHSTTLHNKPIDASNTQEKTHDIGTPC